MLDPGEGDEAPAVFGNVGEPDLDPGDRGQRLDPGQVVLRLGPVGQDHPDRCSADRRPAQGPVQVVEEALLTVGLPEREQLDVNRIPRGIEEFDHQGQVPGDPLGQAQPGAGGDQGFHLGPLGGHQAPPGQVGQGEVGGFGPCPVLAPGDGPIQVVDAPEVASQPILLHQDAQFVDLAQGAPIPVLAADEEPVAVHQEVLGVENAPAPGLLQVEDARRYPRLFPQPGGNVRIGLVELGVGQDPDGHPAPAGPDDLVQDRGEAVGHARGAVGVRSVAQAAEVEAGDVDGPARPGHGVAPDVRGVGDAGDVQGGFLGPALDEGDEPGDGLGDRGRWQRRQDQGEQQAGQPAAGPANFHGMPRFRFEGTDPARITRKGPGNNGNPRARRSRTSHDAREKKGPRARAGASGPDDLGISRGPCSA